MRGLFGGHKKTSGSVEMADPVKEKPKSDVQSPNLILAVKKGDTAEVEKLLADGANPDFQDKEGRTALIWAARNRLIAVAGKLIEAGANPDFQDKEGRTALIWAAQLGRIEVVGKLIEAKADLNIIDGWGDTALIWAVNCSCLRSAYESNFVGRLERCEMVAKKLIDAGADLDIRGDRGRTALICAEDNGCKLVLEALIAAGAKRIESRCTIS